MGKTGSLGCLPVLTSGSPFTRSCKGLGEQFEFYLDFAARLSFHDQRRHCFLDKIILKISLNVPWRLDFLAETLPT
jgi:hypothetical protein